MDRPLCKEEGCTNLARIVRYRKGKHKYGPRCNSHHFKRFNPQMGRCVTPGCNNLGMAKGSGRRYLHCATCLYKLDKRGINGWRAIKREAQRSACWRCGWDEDFIDAYRTIRGGDGGGYTRDNTIGLCPNCRRLATRGMIPKEELIALLRIEGPESRN